MVYAKQDVPWSYIDPEDDEDENRFGRYEHDLEALISQAERAKDVIVDAAKIFPYPEVLRRSESFFIQESKEGGGATNLEDRHMIIPLDDSDEAVYVRSHESRHALFSEPNTKDQEALGVSMLAVEDGRTAMMEKAAGFPQRPDPLIRQIPKVLKKMQQNIAAVSVKDSYGYDPKAVQKTAYPLAVALIATAGEEGHEKIRDAMHESLIDFKGKTKMPPWNKAVRLAKKVAGETIKRMGRPETEPHSGCKTCGRRKEAGQAFVPCIPHDRALAAAQWLETWRIQEGVPPQSTGGNGATSGCTGHGKPQAKGGVQTEGYRPGGSGQQYVYGGENIPHGRKLPEGISEDVWGDMKIQSPPRPHKAVQRSKKAPFSYSRKMGVVPDRIHNWCTGRRVFSWTQPEGNKGGSILIDCSSSMGFSKEALLNFVKAAPAITIAGYSGSHSTGTLRIYVKGGKIVADQYLTRPDAGGNTVDGPAIAWLSEQKAPRIWISDLGVHGKEQGRISPTHLKRECIAFSKKHSIVIIPELEMAERVVLKHFGGKN